MQLYVCALPRLASSFYQPILWWRCGPTFVLSSQMDCPVQPQDPTNYKDFRIIPKLMGKFPELVEPNSMKVTLMIVNYHTQEGLID